MKVLIITGVGDHTGYITRRTKDWKRKYDLEPIVVKFGWEGDYTTNYTRLNDTVTRVSDGEKVALIGISAGGSAAIRLGNELENVDRVVTICARTSRGGFKLISLKSFQAYWDSVDYLSNVEQEKELLIFRPKFDEIVSTDNMGFKEGKVINVPYLFHIPSVLSILSSKSRVIAQFLLD